MRLCGYVLLKKYEGRIINIHPALLPSFKGAHGIQDAFNYGVKVFGVTIHYVDAGMDSGKIIEQRAFHYTEGETVDEVEARIHKIEHEMYPEVVAKLIKEI
jgi:phosphoribosylglycinamide formyltransferase-1